MIVQSFRHYLKLKKSQWWPRERLIELQWQKTKQLIDHSYSNVPFYKELFLKAGIKPSDIKKFSDLELIPIVSKVELRKAFADNTWLAKNYSRSDCAQAVTSGSTGAPLKYLIDKRSLAFRFGMNLRTLEFSTYRLGKKLFQVSPPLSGKLDSNSKQKVIDIFLRRITIPPFETDIDNKFKQLLEYKPSAIVGYASYIKSLADYARDSSIEVKIPTIMTTSEKLPDETRKILCDTFKGQVFDQYGSVETGRSASQCVAANGYHINLESILIEIVNENGEHVKEKELGEVVVTNLMNYATPFLRYKLGDFASFSLDSCSCGRQMPFLEKIGGRLNDIIIKPDGKKIMPEYFYLTLREINGLRQFQVVQNMPDLLEILYSKETGFDESKRLEIEKEYRHYFDDMTIKWSEVSEFKKISGKHKHIIAV